MNKIYRSVYNDSLGAWVAAYGVASPAMRSAFLVPPKTVSGSLKPM